MGLVLQNIASPPPFARSVHVLNVGSYMICAGRALSLSIETETMYPKEEYLCVPTIPIIEDDFEQEWVLHKDKICEMKSGR